VFVCCFGASEKTQEVIHERWQAVKKGFWVSTGLYLWASCITALLAPVLNDACAQNASQEAENNQHPEIGTESDRVVFTEPRE